MAEKQAIEASNRFGFALFQNILQNADANENIFISPLSVSFALGMTYNGSAADTREAMAQALQFNGMTVDEINEAYRGLIDVLTNLDPQVAMQIANAIFYRQGLLIEPEFVDVNYKYFNARVEELDFSQVWAPDTINAWVYENTNGKINHIIDGGISPETLMYLLNAIYFKGNWANPFDTARTMPAQFHLADGTTSTCRMMRRDTVNAILETEIFNAAELTYGDGDFSMILMVPNGTYTVDDIAASLNESNWKQWVGSFGQQFSAIGLPRLKFEYEETLNDILSAMGMGIAFGPSADFSNMISGRNVRIGKVLHKTFVQIDEEGTEAAAVTIVLIPDSLYPSVYCNKPFIMVIRERVSGAIIFMGKVGRPEWTE